MTVPLARGMIDTAKKSIAKERVTYKVLKNQQLYQLYWQNGIFVRYRGFLDPCCESRSLINPEVEGNIKIAKQKMQEIDKKIETLKTLLLDSRSQ